MKVHSFLFRPEILFQGNFDPKKQGLKFKLDFEIYNNGHNLSRLFDV